MEDVNQLYQKFLNQQCSRQEAEELLQYFLTEKGDAEMAQLIEATLENQSLGKITTEDQLSIERNERLVMDKIKPKRESNRYIWYAAAAALLAVLSVTFYFSKDKSSVPTNQIVNHDVLPGGNRATLRLANGKTINLDAKKSGVVIQASQLTYNDGTVIAATQGKSNETSMINTPSGGQYTVELPDGTLVTLNAASSLKFPSTFLGLVNRTVELVGEGYFQVRKDKQHPFIVKSGDQQVEVLGTHFNVTAYANEKNIKTTLVEGSVKISTASGSKLLKPGQQAQVNGTAIQVDEVDIDDAIAWKQGYFIFNEDLESIMKKVSRWYNVEIIYQSKFDPGLGFQGKITRNKNLSEVLKMMEYTEKVHFKIEGRKLIVTN
ncbi:MAG: DUF4974 domain-containing protein [Candidatus Pedobacter colombiensis]|uniref:DUF4974 domain-containing protein n=1 Tax=Candidatus Pedobacter colombiensis TaxID=3121371 RepID=A0AAJ5WD46_9SPHI|nr:FecR family protein [Pedobacter sp.]WEK21340.1 MAG: DUF4974 domain-containing protein [Pedobacter sp.]